MTKTFTVEGSPKGWQRTGYNKRTGMIYTRNDTRARENAFGYAYKRQCKDKFPSGTYISLLVYAFFPVPNSATKTEKEAMYAGKIYPAVKPDFDNIAKLVADALNGIAYDDDKCIVEAYVLKRYVRGADEKPRTSVIVSEVKTI